MARPANQHASSPTISRSARRYGWISDVFGVAYEIFESPQMAGASALLGAASRLVFTGGGTGSDAAAFGATVFAESGFDALHCHPGDLTTGALQLQPGDLVVGIDSDSAVVASALRRAANAGLHTIGVTNRELTIIDADVLLYVPTEALPGRQATAYSLGSCLTLALLAARLDPEAPIASEVGSLEGAVHRVTSTSGRAMASMLFGAGGDGHIIFAGRGASNWVARAMTHSLHSRASRTSAPCALAVDLHDVLEGHWPLQPADILVQIDPYPQPPALPQHHRSADGGSAPHQIWSFTPQQITARGSIHLPVRSPALASLVVYAALTALLEFADSTTIPPA